MPTPTCPTCGRPCTPVYCAASTPEAPLLLAYTTQQAAERLGLSDARCVRRWAEPWHGGWRLVGRLVESPKRPAERRSA